jgi:hypothetical protein
MIKFLGDHLGTVFQTLVTLWMASIARKFQVSMSVYGTRIEAHREAVRRGFVLWWLQHDKNPDWAATMNEMKEWRAMNEVFLEPAAAQALRDIEHFKAMQAAAGGQPQYFDMTPLFNRADEGLDVLRRELLRFRKRTLWEWLRDQRLVRKPIAQKKPAPAA